jgi:hypothetical protein
LPFFLERKQGNQILARKLFIFNFDSLQNRPLINQILVIVTSIPCLIDGWDGGGGAFSALVG